MDFIRLNLYMNNSKRHRYFLKSKYKKVGERDLRKSLEPCDKQVKLWGAPLQIFFRNHGLVI